MRTSILFTFYFLLLTSSFALTRDEIIERFRATPIVNTEGLVQVVPDCPADMRRRFQLDIATFAGSTCKSLNSASKTSPSRFAEPGIVIHIGDVRTNITNVVSRVRKRPNGAQYTNIYLPAPEFASRRALAVAIARAYFRAVHNEDIDDTQAWHALISSDPELRAVETCERLANWTNHGLYTDGLNDEDYLRLSRKVLLPGRLTEYERLQFASRLYLYPLAYDTPFCGRYAALDFRSAIPLCRTNPLIRFAALVKARQVLIFGAGRGEGLQSAAEAYANFLTELARADKTGKTDTELSTLLDTAESLLREAH